MTKGAVEHTKVLPVRVEADGEASRAAQEETHIRVNFLIELLGEAHDERLMARKPLYTPVGRLAHELNDRLRSYRGGRIAIVVEALEESFPIDAAYDYLLATLAHSNLDRIDHIDVCCVTLLVSRPDVMLERARELEHFAARLAKNGTALFVVVSASPEEPDGPKRRRLELRLPSSRHHESPNALVDEPVPESSEVVDVRSQLADQLDLEFGHFAVPIDGTDLHVPLLLSAEQLARSPDCVALLKEELGNFADTHRWLISAVELEGAHLGDLLLPQLVDGDATRVVDGETVVEDRRVVILVDVTYTPQQLRRLADEYIARGARWVGVYALVGTDDDLDVDLPIRTLVDLHVSSDVGRCDLCELAGPAIAGAGIDDVRVHLREYEPAIFWKLIDLMPNFTAVGHWPSPRTPNHYWLRILMGDVLKTFGTGIARRLIHVLEREGKIYVRWIDGIVVADDPESVLLAEKLQEAYHEHAPKIIRADRTMLRAVSPRELTDEANAWVADAGKQLPGRANVIIVDQAAHHLRTYNALKILCDAAGWHTLAFCVVVDRTRIDPEVRQQLHDVHPLALYRWPFPPHLDADCASAVDIS